MTKTILALTAPLPNVGLTCYWVCKEWKTDYYGHHCVKRVQDCKMSQQPLRTLPPKTVPTRFSIQVPHQILHPAEVNFRRATTSAIGTKRTLERARLTSAFGGRADLRVLHVLFPRPSIPAIELARAKERSVE
jgi:hypothetical protein